uniref:NADH ubiquinone oxidoreductase 20 kDa subunit n=1 Tax=Acetithermum autotrophicum TaxID=1446466 RepID=H5SSR8_ACEAU|nr:NADH ubiquinone oxidoreductase 20 kDa subunit [Candidatus Acetothermum autotrophicum]
MIARIQQGHRTIAFPDTIPALPERFRGRPQIDSSRCLEGCRRCAESCPTDAITIESTRTFSVRPLSEKMLHRKRSAGPVLDLGKCLFCPECQNACPEGAICYTQDYRLATRTREALVLRDQTLALAEALDEEARRLFGRSLRLRQVSAGGCNACEADVNVLNTIVFDLGRWGVQFVASPRHADGLLITGPVTQNMKVALQKTYEAVPPPKLVIAVGACAISGGPYVHHPEVSNGANSVVPVDLYIPGCPPHPLTVVDGLVRLLGKLTPEELLRYDEQVREHCNIGKGGNGNVCDASPSPTRKAAPARPRRP